MTPEELQDADDVMQAFLSVLRKHGIGAAMKAIAAVLIWIGNKFEQEDPDESSTH